MSKVPIKQVKLQLQGGKATPAPPVGTSLGPTGINLMEFCKQFNDKTASESGSTLPVVVSIYGDKTFSFIVKVPPVSSLIKKTLGLKSGSGEPNKMKIGTLSQSQLEEIAVRKMPDLNTKDLAAAKSMVRGAARSMGVLVSDE